MAQLYMKWIQQQAQTKYLFSLIGFYTWRGLIEVVHHNTAKVYLIGETDVHKTGIVIL